MLSFSQSAKARAAGAKFSRELADKAHVVSPGAHIHNASCRYIHAAPHPLQVKLALQRAFKSAARDEFERLTGVKII